MNLKENFNNLMDKAKGLKEKELKSYKNILIVFICIDIFGVYWFLKWKGIGIAIMMILMVAFAIILYLENRLPGNKKLQKEISRKPPKDKEAFNLYDLQQSIKGGGWV